MKKRLLSVFILLLAALFLFTCIPFAFAAEPADADISTSCSSDLLGGVIL